MKKDAHMTRAVRPARTPQLSGASAATAAPLALRGRRVLFVAAAGLLGLSGLASCAANVPPSSSGPGVIALFNPGATPAVVPAPTDLVRVGGMLQIPVDPAEATNGALKAFNDYLRGLDGFPPDSTAETGFSDAIDPTSLPEGVVIYDATDSKELVSPEATPALDATQKELVIKNQSRWKHGHTYFVGLLSWTEGTTVHGLRSPDGKAVLTDAAFAILRSPNQIYAKCQDVTNPACACPDLSDSACHAVVDGLTNSQAQQLEVGRQGIKPLIDSVLTLKGRTRNDLVMAFSFTISQRSFATFDSARSQVPFPSNLLLKMQGMGDPLADDTVNLPILPTDDLRTQGLKAGLNTLDGFSTLGSVQFPIDSAPAGAAPLGIAAASVIPNKTAFLVNLVPGGPPALYKAQPLQALLDPINNVSGFAGQIWVTPTSPLIGDRNFYAAVLTTNIKDAMGKALAPAPVTLLITQASPLVIDGQSAISTIPLAQAQQLEQLRLALSPLVTQLKALGIAPSTIAAITVYRTQGIAKPMLQLTGAQAQLSAAGVIPTTVTIDTTVTTLPPTLPNVSAVLHGHLTIRRVVDLRGPFNTTRLAPSPTLNEVIPFLMTLPKAALTPATGAPVVIAQHGLTRWRGDTIAIANSLAGNGQAMIAIDAIYHGARSACLTNADCAAGVSCTAPAPANGLAGQCAGAYLEATGAMPSLPGSTDLIQSPALSQRDFTNLANPFALRDNFRQQTLDLFQLVRVLKDSTAGGLSAKIVGAALQPIDSTKIGYFGQSLGAIMGSGFLALSKDISTGVFNVGGGDLAGMFTDPNSSLSAGVATALGVTPGTPAFFSLLESFRWIVDPADPLNFARYVRTPNPTLIPGRTTGAKVILQEAGLDTVVTNPFTLLLGKALGLPYDAMGHLQGIDGEGGTTPTNVTTFFATADHGAVFNFTNLALTLQIQDQASTYLGTGLSGAAPTVK